MGFCEGALHPLILRGRMPILRGLRVPHPVRADRTLGPVSKLFRAGMRVPESLTSDASYIVLAEIEHTHDQATPRTDRWH